MTAASPTEPANKTFLPAAIQKALSTVKTNAAAYGGLHPDCNSHGEVYPLRPPRTVSSPLHGSRQSFAGENVEWTAGFWPGTLWLAYELSDDQTFRNAAAELLPSFRERLDNAWDIEHHDLGFLYTLSAVAEYKLTGNEAARQLGLDAATYLMRRYLASAGIIQAWGSLDNPEQMGRIIIDALMNLPLLYWASEQTGDSRFKDAAYAHAQKSLQTIIREDSTTFHTFFFDVETGNAKHGRTAQGYSDESCWTRGQAWGIYGFALSYRYTKAPVFLEASRRLADYFLKHTPPDDVVFWDFALNDVPGAERDTSASAIAACGFDELARWLPADEGQSYRAASLRVLEALNRNYTPKEGSPSNALLLEGVYAFGTGRGVHEANLWGDYYYLEGLARHTKEWSPYW